MTAALECHCCGRTAARGVVSDGQPLACGCRGAISVDAESEPYVVVDECDCGGEGVPAQRKVRP